MPDNAAVQVNELDQVRREIKQIANQVLGVADGLHTTNMLRSRQLDQIARALLALAAPVAEEEAE